MNGAIEFLIRERDSLNRRINKLDEYEQLLNTRLEETVIEKVNAIHARNDINEALNKLIHDDLPTRLEGSE